MGWAIPEPGFSASESVIMWFWVGDAKLVFASLLLSKFLIEFTAFAFIII